jgi:cytoskeleton protein RodZ
MTNFGATFKKARESRGISLDQIAHETRISTRFLAAIENEEFQVLPGGVFNRGFVRSFAEAVGLDPDQAVADYERLSSVPQPNDVLTAATAGPPKSERNLYPVAVVVLAIAVAIFYFVTRESAPTIESSNPPKAAAPAGSPAPAQPAAPTPAPAPAPSPAVSAEPEPPPSAPKTQVLTLDIHALEKTWIKVDADGNSANTGEVLEPGMTRKFTAENSLHLSVGNAAGLTLKINDMPVKPLGKSGQVRSVIITPTNLKDFIG